VSQVKSKLIGPELYLKGPRMKFQHSGKDERYWSRVRWRANSSFSLLRRRVLDAGCVFTVLHILRRYPEDSASPKKPLS
jgi:hypothetical protein